MAQRHLKIDPANRLVTSKYVGQVKTQDVIEQWADIRRHPDFDPSFDVLVDNSEVTEYQVSYVDQCRLASDNDPFSDTSIRVFVAQSDLLYGMLRVYQVAGEQRHRNVHVVHSIEEATQILFEARKQREQGIPQSEMDTRDFS